LHFALIAEKSLAFIIDNVRDHHVMLRWLHLHQWRILKECISGAIHAKSSSTVCHSKTIVDARRTTSGNISPLGIVSGTPVTTGCRSGL
jgi:hypothetical protein